MTWLHSQAEIILAVALDKGFTRPSWDNLPAKLLWAAAELVEAEEGQWGEELADVAMRVCGAMHAIWGHTWSDRTVGKAATCNIPDRYQSRPALLWPILRHLTKAGEAWRKENPLDAEQHMGLALLAVWRLAAALELDMQTEIERKLEHNRHRPYLHGKAKKEG